MVKMDSKIFDLERFHKKNVFLSKDILNIDQPETIIIDNES